MSPRFVRAAARGVVASALVLCAPAAGFVASASAVPPERVPLDPLAFPGSIDCGSFTDNFVDFFTGTQTVYFDKGGRPIRVVQHVAHRSNDVNSVSGLTIHEHGHFTATINLVKETFTLTGAQEIANRPGTGVVVQDAGRVVFDANDNVIFFAGPRAHSELFNGDQVLCDALA